MDKPRRGILFKGKTEKNSEKIQRVSCPTLIFDFKRRSSANQIRKTLPPNAELVFLKARKRRSIQIQYLKAFIGFAEDTALKNENWKPLSLD